MGSLCSLHCEEVQDGGRIMHTARSPPSEAQQSKCVACGLQGGIYIWLTALSTELTQAWWR